MAIALGLAACRQGKRVQFFTAAGLVNQLEEAQKQYRLDRLLAQLDRIDLLICDELGYLSFSRGGAELLFQVFADRYERRSLLMTSNLAFSEWGQVFQGERMTAALLDRLTHRCHIFEMNGESYRFRESMKAKKDKDQEEQVTLPPPGTVVLDSMPRVVRIRCRSPDPSVFFFDLPVWLVASYAKKGQTGDVSFSDPDTKIPAIRVGSDKGLPIFTDSDLARRFIENLGVPNPVLVRFDDCKLFLNLLVDAKCFGYTTVAIDTDRLRLPEPTY